MNGLSLPAKAAIAFTIASFLEKGISFFTTPIFTRILDPSEYGLISVYGSWLGIITVLATLNLTHGTLNSAMIHIKNRNEYLSSTLILSNVATIILFFIYLLFKDPLDNIIQLPFNLIVLIFILCLFNPALNFWMSRNRYEYKYKMPLLLMVCNSVLSPIISIILVSIATENEGIIKIWSSAIISLLFSFFFYFIILRKGKVLVNKEYWSFALKLAIPLVPHYLSLIILSSIDKIMISNIVGMDSAGYYSVAYTLGATVSIAWGSINSSLIPWQYEKFKENKIEGINNIVSNLILAFGIFCVTVMLFAPELLMILAPSEYMEAVYVIPPVIAGVFFTSLYSIFANIEFYYKKTNYTMLASIFSAIFNIVLNFLFIPKYGYIAAAYTTLITYILNSIFHYFFMRRVERRKIYDMRKITLYSFLVITSSVLVIPLYNYIYIRYSIVICVIAILIYFRKKVIGLFRKLK